MACLSLYSFPYDFSVLICVFPLLDVASFLCSWAAAWKARQRIVASKAAMKKVELPLVTWSPGLTQRYFLCIQTQDYGASCYQTADGELQEVHREFNESMLQKCLIVMTYKTFFFTLDNPFKGLFTSNFQGY